MRVISTRLDEDLYKELRKVSYRKNMTMSDCARNLIGMGLFFDERLSEWLEKFSETEALIRPLLEEVLVSLFGMEALVVKTYLEPVQVPKLDKKAREKIVREADDQARELAKKLLSGDSQ